MARNSVAKTAWAFLVWVRLVVEVAADHEPDGVDRFGALVEEPVGEGGVERDGVAGTQLVLVEADLDDEGARDDVAVLAALVAHQRLVDGG
jgi:hypothetical protein